MENLDKLINELRHYEDETPWIEFKHNNYDPEMIGQDISALANGAALHEKNCAYMLWGIHDGTHDIVGTDYNLQTQKRQPRIGKLAARFGRKTVPVMACFLLLSSYDG